MSDSPLLRRARERMAAQREKERQQWEIQPAALQKSMIRWIFRIFGFMILIVLVVYRFRGGRLF
jgi:hypothetical protein